MEDKDYYKNFSFDLDNMKEPDDEAAEAMLKRLEKQEQFKANRSFKESLGNKIWRTRDGRYIDFDKMDDNHLMNSYNLVERNISKYMQEGGYTVEGVIKGLELMRSGELDNANHTELEDAKRLKAVLGDQIKGYKFLHDEIVNRNLFGRKLAQATEEVFDVFDDIINFKPEDNDETQ